MKPVTWQGRRDVEVREVSGPRIEVPDDARIHVTSTAACGPEVHLFDPLTPPVAPEDKKDDCPKVVFKS